MRSKSKQHKVVGAPSKYDYVKVKVWIPGPKPHYYILSRYLISRMLTAAKVPPQHAVKVALQLKKYFVDTDTLNITQMYLQRVLDALLYDNGYGYYSNTVHVLEHMLTQRIPLIIVLAGTACAGLSTITQQLSSRLNLPNVIQSQLLHYLHQSTPARAPLWSTTRLQYALPRALWSATTGDPAACRCCGVRSCDGTCKAALREFINELQRQCDKVYFSLQCEVDKTYVEGKTVMIEGPLVDPTQFIHTYTSAQHHVHTTTAARSLHCQPRADHATSSSRNHTQLLDNHMLHRSHSWCAAHNHEQSEREGSQVDDGVGQAPSRVVRRCGLASVSNGKVIPIQLFQHHTHDTTRSHDLSIRRVSSLMNIDLSTQDDPVYNPPPPHTHTHTHTSSPSAVFIPVLLTVPETEHRLLLSSWLRDQYAVLFNDDVIVEHVTRSIAPNVSPLNNTTCGARVDGALPAGPTLQDDVIRRHVVQLMSECVIQRARAVDYWFKQKAAAYCVPIVSYNISNMGEIVDELHEYVLNCVGHCLQSS